MKQWQEQVGDTLEIPAENRQPPASISPAWPAFQTNGSRNGS